jgi:hypothetical protein
MVDVQKTSEGPVGVGTTYRIVNHVLGRRIEGEAEVTEYELNRKYAASNKSGPRIETQRMFEAVDGGTRVTFAVDADLAGIFQLAELEIASMARRRLENDVADLKDLLEHSRMKTGLTDDDMVGLLVTVEEDTEA